MNQEKFEQMRELIALEHRKRHLEATARGITAKRLSLEGINDDRTMVKVVDALSLLCGTCRLQVAKMIIWNAKAEELSEIIELAKGYMPTDREKPSAHSC